MLSDAIAKSKHLPEGDDMQRQLHFAVNADAHKEPFRGILRQAQDDIIGQLIDSIMSFSYSTLLNIQYCFF